MKQPLITEIQRFSLQDGPGIRTTVFLKGCPLKCPWCHNPETQDTKREFYYYADRCTHCGRCAAVCPTGASHMSIALLNKSELKIDRLKCVRCMKCVDACLSGARAVVGQELSMDDVLKEVLSDRLFYGNSGGGVTISGGEPLFFPEFTLELVKKLKKESLKTAIETSCFQRWDKIEPLIDFIDLFIVDIKSFDHEKHREIIGWPLSPILLNIERLITAGARVRIHLPIIPNFNDNDTHIKCCIEFLSKFSEKLDGVDILPYHVYGEKKYDLLGRGDSYQYKSVPPSQPSTLIPFGRELKRLNIKSITFDGLIGTKETG
jgi:pyruvate formate lyase activating enzyme